MLHSPPRSLLAVAAAASALLSACGGGSGSSTAEVPVTVLDGYIRNALVCLDKNANDSCDASEPWGRTDAAGKVTLQVDPADKDRYTVLAMVGTDAEDADFGPVTQAFVMKAPANHPGLVSPLTTLVQATMDSTGASAKDAEASLRGQLGITLSLLDDFKQAGGSDGASAALLARLVVVATQEQSKSLAASVGKTAFDGSPITQAAVDKAIQQQILQIIPSLVAAAGDARLQGTSGSERGAMIATIARELAAAEGLNATTLAVAVGINGSATAAESATPNAFATLRELTYTDPKNWYARSHAGTVAQNTPDASGVTRFVDRRRRSVAGAVAAWNTGGSPARQTDLHWNGAGWVNCGFNQAFLSSVRDAQGRSTYDYCDKLDAGSGLRSTVDVSGQKMVDVYNDKIAAAGLTNISIAGAAAALGDAVFPKGSLLYHQLNVPLTRAIAYYPGSGNVVFNTVASVAAGKTSGDDRTAACASINLNTPTSTYQVRSTTLESLIAANPGTPCIYTAPGSATVAAPGGGTVTVQSGSRHEWWGQSTASVGIIGNASPLGTYFTGNLMLRVAFGPGNTVRYYGCQQPAFATGSPRNCDLLGTSTYAIATLGDARVLTLGTPPPQAGPLTYERVFVERGGTVYLGYRNKQTTSTSARFNTTGGNALLSQLGVPPIDPDVPLALTQQSYEGDWLLSPTPGGASLTLRVFANGSPPACLSDAVTLPGCTVTLAPETGAFTISSTAVSGSGRLDFLSGSAELTASGGAGPVPYTGGRR